MAPMKKMALSHLPLWEKVFLTFLKNVLNGIGFSFDFGTLTRNHTKIVEMKEKTGMAKNGRNQTMPANMEPKIGLNTFPKVLDVSMIPRVLLTSYSFLNISPTKGITIGAPPAAPTPCKDLPSKIIQ